MTKYITGFALALFMVPALVFVAHAQDDTTEPTLEDKVAALEAAVAELTADLAAAETDIAELTSRIEELESGSSDESSDDSMDADADEDEQEDLNEGGKGGVALCHKGRFTIRVAPAAVPAHLAQPDTSLGMCGKAVQWKKGDVMEDDSSDDDGDDSADEEEMEEEAGDDSTES